MPNKIPVTQSSLKTLSVCEEQYRLKYVEGLRSREYKPALTIGTAYHLGVELHSVDEAEKSYRESRGTPWTEAERVEIETDVSIIRAMVGGALSRWKIWPLLREVEFELPLRNPATGAKSTRHAFCGVIDGIFPPLQEKPEAVQEGLGSPRYVLQELKTAGRMSPSYFQRLDLDSQVTDYLIAASDMLGEPVREVVYRVAKKPGIKPQKKVKRADGIDERGKARFKYSPETPEEFSERVRQDYLDRPEFYFFEVIVKRTEEQLDRRRFEMWEAHQRVLRVEAGQMTIRNVRSCLDFGRCDYLDLCRGVITPEAFDRLDSPHPELASEKENENACS